MRFPGDKLSIIQEDIPNAPQSTTQKKIKLFATYFDIAYAKYDCFLYE